MATFFLIITLAFALLDWWAVARQNKPLELFAKPAVMLALLGWLWAFTRQSGGLPPNAGYLWWFVAGLILSLAGDVFLMLPREQFIAGLVSFLLAHVAYVIGLNQSPPPISAASLILIPLLAAVWLQVFRGIAGGLKEKGLDALLVPVAVYAIAISLMLYSALLTLVRSDTEWAVGPALLVAGGALLFFVSDTVLAWNKFVTPLAYGRLRVIITYHLGQILIASGAALHFLNL